ncbi:MAG: 30S ribosome-binding factor RbfA [Bacteroidota bacterium]
MKESTRQKKLGRRIQQELSEIFQREMEMPAGAMLTVTVVRVTGDLREARVYISIFPDKDAETHIRELNERQKEVRGFLGRRIRKQVRHIPEMFFYLDDTQQEVAHIESLLSSIQGSSNEEE